MTTREGGGPQPAVLPPHFVVRVQHHPSRADLLRPLLPRLAGLPVEVVEDPDPTGKRSAWRCYRECLSRPTDSDWIVVLQDDVVPADGFAAALPEILDAQPGKVVALFLAGAPPRVARRARQAASRDQRYVEFGWLDWVPTVATAWPTDLAHRFVEWSSVVPADHQADDSHVGKWVREARVEAVATVPSVVQHPDIEPSLIGRRHGGGKNPHRTAAVWSGNALYDWDPGDR